MNLMGTCPAATLAHETKTLPKQETDADYSCKAMVCQRYEYMPSVCVTLAVAIVGPRLPPHPALVPSQMKEDRVIHIITQHIILQDRGAAAGSHLGRIVLRSRNINIFYFAWYTER